MDLRPDDVGHLEFDLARHVLGTAPCGPGVLPQYRLTATKASFSLIFTPVS